MLDRALELNPSNPNIVNEVRIKKNLLFILNIKMFLQ